MTARCISPHCPTDCSGCNHAIDERDDVAVLVVDLLLDAGLDGHGSPYEDGEHSVVDRARAFLRNRAPQVGKWCGNPGCTAKHTPTLFGAEGECS